MPSKDVSAHKPVDEQGLIALANLYHAYFLGLQLMVSTRLGDEVMEQWMFRLFRRQQEENFLSSFSKLGLHELPDAVACAQYHTLSNAIGGVAVEYIYENDRKAWVRFRYPRWMYAGPTICGITDSVSRGFLKGWYGQNGVSLNNSRLGFVCVSEDMTGEFGLCGYFKEFDHDLLPNQRLSYAKDERPPLFRLEEQPLPPQDQWDEQRLLKAQRNYPLTYLRNGLIELAGVIGIEEAKTHGELAARLIGLQYSKETADLLEMSEQPVSSDDADLARAAMILARLFRAMGDTVEVQADDQDGLGVILLHSGLRIVRDLAENEAALVLSCWGELWNGFLSADRKIKSLEVYLDGSSLRWLITSNNS
jgi:hypothetical protein